MPNASACTACALDTYLPTPGASACLACIPGEYTAGLDLGATTCQACRAGGFIRPDLRTCQACSAGEYSGVDGALECQLCMAGTFSESEASACTNCGVGSYTPFNGTVYCLKCPTGKFFNQTGASRCLDCLAGTFFAGEGGSACQSCQMGKYSLDGAYTCLPCQPGAFSELDGARTCDPCGPGRFSTAYGVTTCQACQQGTFNNETGVTECETCAAGKFSGVGAVLCSNCSAGTYSIAGMTACQACPHGTYSVETGVTALARCVFCESGKYLQDGGTACLTCGPGNYSGLGASECTACPTDSDSLPGSGLDGCICRGGFRHNRVNGSTISCLSCTAGTFSTVGASACRECPRGEFSTVDRATVCFLCESGLFLAVMGGSACQLCPAGLYTEIQAGTQCLQCQAGSFGSVQGRSTCQACSEGSYWTGLAATTCEQCETGTYVDYFGATGCTACQAGAFASSLGLSVCDACPAGTYSTRFALPDATGCTGCPEGYYSTGTGLTTLDNCVRCAVGKTGDIGATACGDCRPGQFPNDPYGGCAVCPRNSENGVNASRPEDCRCGPGYRLGYSARGVGGVEAYSGPTTRVHVFQDTGERFRLFMPTIIQASCDDEDLRAPIALTIGEFPGSQSCLQSARIQYQVDVQFNATETQTYAQCVPCPAGTFSLGMTGESCQPCPNRTFQDQTGATSCKLCPSGNRANQGMPRCEPCPGRMVVQDGECQPCPEGRFYPVWASEPACLQCPANMWSAVTALGSSECQVCPKDSVGPGGTGLRGCICATGMEMAVAEQACVKCVAGKYSTTGVCLPCPNGTYNTAVGAGECLKCPNYAVAWNGAVACRTCVLGTVPSVDGGSCVPCPAGYFCGIGTVFLCPLGTYSLKTGLISRNQCPPCPANSFCRSPTTIQPCPANTYSQPGSITRHYCRCNNGYKCTYYFTTSGQIMLSLTPEQLVSQRDALIAAVAQAAGVNPSKVQILGVADP